MSDTLRTDLCQLSCAHMDDQEWGAAGWDHSRQLERELAEVTKQRDALMSAMEQIGGGAHSWKTCVDQIAPRAIAEATGQTYDEVVKKLTGLEGGQP